MDIVLASGIVMLCAISVALLILIAVLAGTHRAIQAQTRRHQAARIAEQANEERSHRGES